MNDMVIGILQDNAGQVAERGFTNDDIIDTYEQSCEVMMLNERWKKKVEFRDVVAKLLARLPGAKIEEGGADCCGKGDESPEMKVLALLPKLNEVIIEIIMELASAKNQYGQPMAIFDKESFFTSLARFTAIIYPINKTARRKVSCAVNVEGLGNNFKVGDMVTTTATVERIKHVKDYEFERKLWIACVTSGKSIVQEFEQREDSQVVKFKTIMDKPGKVSFKVMVIDGYGEFQTSFKKEVTVLNEGG